MKILGVDPGTQYAGYAILEKLIKIKLLDYGCLNISKKPNLMKKVGTLFEFFSVKVQENEITHIALETPFLYKNPATFLKLGYVRGILYLIAEQNDLEIIELSPCEVKKQITGYGNASKEQVANIVMKFFPLKKTPRTDTTDAIGIALCGAWSQ